MLILVMQLLGQEARTTLALGLVMLLCFASVDAAELQVMPGAWRILPASFQPFERHFRQMPVSRKSPEQIDEETNDQQLWQPMFERVTTQEEQQASLSDDLIEAILRIEGMFDPTRVGFFGPALRMKIRSGTAMMDNVFGDQWFRPTLDPNIHRRLEYIAWGWLNHKARDCSEFRKFRPDDTLVLLDNIDTLDCAAIKNSQLSRNSSDYALLTDIRPSLPIFASPFPGARFSREALVKMQHQMAISRLQDRIGMRPRFRASAAF